MNLLIKNGTVINADGRCIADVAVSDGKIIMVKQNIKPGVQTEVVDASGLLVLPGAVDVHTHFELSFGEFTSADDFFSGTKAAACGGTTTVIDFVTPEQGEGLITALQKRKAEADPKVCIDYSLHMGLSEVNDRVINEMKSVADEGISSFKVFMTYAFKLSDDEFERTMTQAKTIGALVMVHAEDHETLEKNRAEFIAAGKKDAWYHYLSRPEEVEAKAVKKAIELAEKTGTSLYVVHLACADGLKAVEKAQRDRGCDRGTGTCHTSMTGACPPVTSIYAETCPQYLKYSSDVYKRPDGRNFVCSPPIKSKASRDALWWSVTQGTSPYGINTIATDHCPFDSYVKDRGKNDFTQIPNGVMGVENMYPYLLAEANNKQTSFERIVELCSYNPAKIFGCTPAKGMIVPGADADIVLYDTKKEFTISQKNMHSNIDYTIWEGVKLKGYPTRTYSRGKLVYNDGVFTGTAGYGAFLKRTKDMCSV